MDLYPPICRNIIAPLWAAREKSPYLRVARELKRNEFKSGEQVQGIQLQKLRQIIQHAWVNTEYYNEKWQAAGFKPNDLKSLKDLINLPILTKDDIRANKGRMVA